MGEVGDLRCTWLDQRTHLQCFLTLESKIFSLNMRPLPCLSPCRSALSSMRVPPILIVLHPLPMTYYGYFLCATGKKTKTPPHFKCTHGIYLCWNWRHANFIEKQRKAAKQIKNKKKNRIPQRRHNCENSTCTPFFVVNKWRWRWQEQTWPAKRRREEVGEVDENGQCLSELVYLSELRDGHVCPVWKWKQDEQWWGKEWQVEWNGMRWGQDWGQVKVWIMGQETRRLKAHYPDKRTGKSLDNGPGDKASQGPLSRQEKKQN